MTLKKAGCSEAGHGLGLHNPQHLPAKGTLAEGDLKDLKQKAWRESAGLSGQYGPRVTSAVSQYTIASDVGCECHSGRKHSSAKEHIYVHNFGIAQPPT